MMAAIPFEYSVILKSVPFDLRLLAFGVLQCLKPHGGPVLTQPFIIYMNDKHISIGNTSVGFQEKPSRSFLKMLLL